MRCMNAQREIFEHPSDNHIAKADARARGDAENYRTVPHAEVRDWLRKVGSADETPMPPGWLK